MSCDNCVKEIEDEYKFNNKFYCNSCSLKKIYCTHCGNKSSFVKYILFEHPLCVGCERKIDLYDKNSSENNNKKEEEDKNNRNNKVELFVVTSNLRI